MTILKNAALLLSLTPLVAVEVQTTLQQVKVDTGVVQGAPENGITAFRGIPYAAPPLGNLRWRAPQPAAKWTGVRAATEYGADCAQLPFPSDAAPLGTSTNEDCLYVNVWTPAHKAKEKLPVMVWIYGGGYVAGTTSEPRQDGEHLAHKGVVVVSMNYRLGIFGFYAGTGLAEESEHHAAGNYGLMDQTAAIAWVKKNIKNFGGDPENVTIFGESAGSFSVSVQMASPLAQGLFQHAIGESGGAFSARGLRFKSLSEVEKANADWATATFGTSDLTALRAMGADDLLAKMKAQPHTVRSPVGPDVDGYFLTEPVSTHSMTGNPRSARDRGNACPQTDSSGCTGLQNSSHRARPPTSPPVAEASTASAPPAAPQTVRPGNPAPAHPCSSSPALCLCRFSPSNCQREPQKKTPCTQCTAQPKQNFQKVA